MHRHFPLLLALAGLHSGPLHAEPAAAPAPVAAIPHNYARWENDIAAFGRKDAEATPPKGAVLFVGSSTIARWKSLAQDFPGVPVLNRGFGGSQIADSTYYAERIIFPYEPRMIVLRAGTNDLHAGRSPEEVFHDFQNFVAKVRTRLPRVTVAYISQCPTISRWKEREAARKLDTLISRYAGQTQGVKVIDAAGISLNSEGAPRPELFVPDKLHFNSEGYKLLADAVRPHLQAAAPASTAGAGSRSDSLHTPVSTAPPRS